MRKFPPPIPPAAGARSQIHRQELDQFLKLGPQDFIQRVRVRPSFRAGTFVGWRVLAYRGPGPVRPGDVVLGVNGNNLERPEQFMEVWDRLGSASNLVLELLRSGQRLSFRYVVTK
jgi:type II secretory pathway component PulC